jgi:PPIC-type PPIASE domain
MTQRPRQLLRWVLRHPVGHFAVIGAVLFALRGTMQRAVEDVPAAAMRAPVVISAERIRLMQADFEQRWGTPPTPPQLRAIVERAIEEDILYREARLLALGFGDGSVRRRLVEKARAVTRRRVYTTDELYQEALALGLDDDLVIRRLLAEKMRLFLQQEPGDAPIPEAAMVEYMQRNRARFVQPETITLTHVFFSRNKRRERLAADAAAASTVLVGQPPSSAVVELSDPFPLGHQLRAYAPRQLIARFGKPFADQVLAMQPGSWSAPLVSPYGLHLVWVHQHEPERLPSLETVRETVALAVMRERAARNLQTGLARLRNLYDVRVEGSL